MTAHTEHVRSLRAEEHYGATFPVVEGVIRTDDPRATFVAKMRDLADRVESGALNGARCEWNDNPDQPAMVWVECFPVVDGQRTVRLTRATFERITPSLRLVQKDG